MKKLAVFTASAALLPSFLHGQSQEDYVNLIYQIQDELQEDGSILKRSEIIEVESKGDASSPLVVPLTGAQFELWTINSISNEEFLLDTAVVGASRPKAEIVIKTDDSSSAGVPRTRADKPFTVVATYSDLQTPGAGVDERTTKLNWFHYTRKTEEALLDSAVITSNKEDSKVYSKTNIKPAEGQNPNDIKGYEKFEIELFSNELTSGATAGSSEESPLIVSKEVEVFPVPTVKLMKFGADAVVEGETITFANTPSTMEFKVENAYPGSKISLKLLVERAGGFEDPDSSPNDETGDDSIIEPNLAKEVLLWNYNVPKDITPADLSREDEMSFTEVFKFTKSNFAVQSGDKLTFVLTSEDPFGTQTDKFEAEANFKIVVRGSVYSSEE